MHLNPGRRRGNHREKKLKKNVISFDLITTFICDLRYFILKPLENCFNQASKNAVSFETFVF